VVVGPGNRRVTAAKQLVAGQVDIDMLAGPSELVVLADGSGDARLVAADLLAQAEHDPDAVPALVTTEPALAEAVAAEVQRQLAALPEPNRATATAACGNGFIAIAKDLDEAVAVRLSQVSRDGGRTPSPHPPAAGAERARGSTAPLVSATLHAVNLVDELYAVARALREAGVPYAVCGGVAVTMHGATRTTKDIDLLVSAGHVMAALEALRPLGYVFAALPMTFERGTPRERHVQRVTKVVASEHLVVDLIVEDAAFAGLLSDALTVGLPGGEVAVVSLPALARMKRLAARPQDLADLERLGLRREGPDDG